MHFDKILITTDFSESSFAAFELPAYAQKMEESTISIVSVIDDWQVPEVFLRQIPNPESIEQYRHDLKERNEIELNKLSEKYFPNQPVTTHVLLTNGGAAEEICKFAREEGIELIILASHGKGAIGKLFLGSTVQKIIAQAPCPVLVVPKQK